MSKCRSSWYLLNENCLETTSYNKKKLNIGNNKLIEKIKICISSFKILDRLSFGINPPEDIVVKAKLKESRSLKSIELYKKIIKIVEIK